VDSAGNVYVAGSTGSTDFPTTGGFDTTLDGGSPDAFVTKVSAAGSNLVWSSYLGGGGLDSGSSIAVDSASNVYVAGFTRSADFPTTGGFDTTYGGSSDAFVTKVNAARSSLAWSSYLGGADTDHGNGIAVDSAGDVYVAGDTDSSDFPTTGGFDTTDGGGTDVFVTKVNAAGSSLAWSSYLEGFGQDDGGTRAATAAAARPRPSATARRTARRTSAATAAAPAPSARGIALRIAPAPSRGRIWAS